MVDLGVTIKVGSGIACDLDVWRKSRCHNIKDIADRVLPRPIS